MTMKQISLKSDLNTLRCTPPMVKLYSRLMGGAVLLALGIALIFPPKHWEGPSLLSLGGGHGITISDLIALFPLCLGTVFVFTVLWQLRAELGIRLVTLRNVGAVEIFLAGIAVGVLVGGLCSSLDRQGSIMLIWGVIAAAFGAVAISRKPYN